MKRRGDPPGRPGYPNTKEVIELDQDTLETEAQGRGDAENPELSTQNPQPSAGGVPDRDQPLEALESLRAELEEARTRGLEAHRRALLAENAGRVIPELVAGTTFEEMDASVALARAAFESARTAALAEMASTPIPAGNPVRQGPSVETMSPIEKIALGLKRD